MEKTELEKRLEAGLAAKAADEQADMEPLEAIQTGPDPTLAALRDELGTLRIERDDFKDQLTRLRAEMDNYRKRTAREIERIRRTAAEGLLSRILPVSDHLELALRHREDATGGLADGVEMVLKQLHEVLGQFGLEPIPAIGLPFDPVVHEALMQREDASVPDGTVLEEFQRGYLLAGQVLRPSKVVVSTGGPESRREAPVSPAAVMDIECGEANGITIEDADPDGAAIIN